MAAVRQLPLDAKEESKSEFPAKNLTIYIQRFKFESQSPNGLTPEGPPKVSQH